jgi:hypothetical protein
VTTQSTTEPQAIGFAFPFRDVHGKDIVDEHLFYDWLASEGSGNFAVTGSGMWHGGIHVSADGAGRQLDLAHGVRCIADGEVVAYRINRTSLISQIAAGAGKPAETGHYSSAFTLVRHTFEYPAKNRLTFFSLYMHLQSLTDYLQKSMQPPPYWARSLEVTQYATDKPKTDAHHGAPSAAQPGLNIHMAAGDRTILGILPRGARVRIGERSRDGKWGRIDAIESGSLLPPRVAGDVQGGAQKGWVYLRKERGHPLLTEVVSEIQCEQVVVPPTPIRINAGDLIGHLGQYWMAVDPARDNRMVHIEVFCGDTLSGFLSRSREAAHKIEDFAKLPLLRIDRDVKLFAGPSIHEEGANAPETAVVQIYSQAALDALPADCKRVEDDASGDGEPWWKIISADSRYADIPGWVRNRQMPYGRVTRESPHAWMDFETVAGSDAGNPTIFSTVDAWLDHALCEDKPATGDAGKLKPLACSVYRALSPMRNESQAADELRAHKDNKWLRFRASRLIPKHRSEWASQSEYQRFFEKVLMRVAKEPYHDAELERIKQLVWWGEVHKHVTQPFPSVPDVFHLHPIALVGNFSCSRAELAISEAGLRFIYRREAQVNVSNHLHWPGGSSGVTLGPGYDMKARNSAEVQGDLIAIGVVSDVASEIAGAAGLAHSEAKNFALENKNLVSLSQDQEMNLLRHVVPHYEKLVRDRLNVSLQQNQFDALVSFAYNPGGQLRKVMDLINQKMDDEAMDVIRSVVKSGGVVVNGLVNRRNLEVNLYKNGAYN